MYSRKSEGSNMESCETPALTTHVRRTKCLANFTGKLSKSCPKILAYI